MEKVNDSFHLSRTFRYDIIYIIQLICSYLSFLFWKGGFSLKIPKNNLQASIVLPSILFIGIVIISCIFFPDRTDTILSIVKEYIFSSYSVHSAGYTFFVSPSFSSSWSSYAWENSVTSAWETKMKNQNFPFFPGCACCFQPVWALA